MTDNALTKVKIAEHGLDNAKNEGNTADERSAAGNGAGQQH